MADILVVKVTKPCSGKIISTLFQFMMETKKHGVIILPEYCEALVVPDDTKIKIEDLTTSKGENYE